MGQIDNRGINGGGLPNKQLDETCHWAWIQNLPDPTRVFSFLVMSIMVIRYLIMTNMDYQAVLWGFFLNPCVVLSLSLACATVWWSLPHSPLPVYDRWSAEWYWWNAWLYHMTMDGASGTFRLVPVVVQQYDILDKRFPNRHVVPWSIGLLELVVMAPLCLITLWAILKRNSLRFPLEIMTSTIQLVGMIFFILAEVYEDQVNVPALDPVGVPGHAWANVKLNFYHFTYYWFGFWFCNLIWFFVPIVRIHRAVYECRMALESSGAQNGKVD